MELEKACEVVSLTVRGSTLTSWSNSRIRVPHPLTITIPPKTMQSSLVLHSKTFHHLKKWLDQSLKPSNRHNSSAFSLSTTSLTSPTCFLSGLNCLEKLFRSPFAQSTCQRLSPQLARGMHIPSHLTVRNDGVGSVLKCTAFPAPFSTEAVAKSLKSDDTVVACCMIT